ncbi:hypothetical protein Tco_0965366 [Tanacetum coccineum]
MLTQQDSYAAGLKNHSLMLNNDNYVPWSSHLLRYAKRKPNGKLLVNSILHGPYTDDELAKKEAKQMKADDRAIQTILMSLPEDIYAAVDNCDTAQEIWLCVEQMMKDYTAGYEYGSRQTYENGWRIANQNANQNGNGNVVAARAKGNGNGNNGNQIRCYNYKGVGHYAWNYTEIKEVNANYILMANLQQTSTSGTHADKDPIYNSDGSAKVHQYENYYNNEIFNMFTQEEQYTELLESTTEPHLDQHNNSNVTHADSSMEHSGGIVEEHPATVEEIRAFFESLYNNLVIKVKKVNTVNHKIKEANDELTTELSRYKG